MARQDAISQYLTRLQASLSRFPAPPNLAVDGADLGFSSRPCEVCGHRAGGDRYLVHMADQTGLYPGEWIDMAACQDCLLYLANGDLPQEDCGCMYCQREASLR